MNKLWIAALLALAGCNASETQPSVILIGDSFRQGYAPYVQVAYPAASTNSRCQYFMDVTTKDTDNAGSSARVAACIDLWLDGQHYDVVHFNAGMHDVHINGCQHGNTRHQVELSDYLINLQRTLDSIRAHGAVPVFATTVPVNGDIYCHSNSDIEIYNAAAKELMESQGVEVDDLYAAALPHISDFELPGNIHFTDDGYQFLAQQVVDSLIR